MTIATIDRPHELHDHLGQAAGEHGVQSGEEAVDLMVLDDE